MWKPQPIVTLLENGAITLSYFGTDLEWTPAEVRDLKSKGAFVASSYDPGRLRRTVIHYAEHLNLIPLTPLYL